MSATLLAYPLHVRRYSEAPLDDRKRPYYPDWVGEHVDTYMMLPTVGLGFLVASRPYEPEASATMKVVNP